MKKRKHLKTVLISLISLLGLATITTTLASCSSNSSQTSSSILQSSNTVFTPSLDAKSNLQLSKLLASEFNSDTNKKILVNFIFNNGIIGKKDDIKETDIIINSLMPDDVNGTLNLTYTIKDYWENDAFIIKDKVVKLTITGFVKGSAFKDTTFDTMGNVSSYINLKNLLPSEAKTITNQNYLLNYIFQNLIHGKKDKLSVSNISFTNANADDTRGTLDVTYTIQNYWLNNVKMTDIKSVTVNLSGFVKLTVPTEFNNLVDVNVASNVELAKLSTNELNSNKPLLQKLLFDSLIIGNKEGLDFNNIVISNFINENSENGTITVNYQVNKYWSNKGIVLNNNKSFSTNLIGFKKVHLSDQQILQEINLGGSYEGLTVDKFLPIIQSLQINAQYRLNSLTDKIVNDKLKTNPNFVNINLEISSGNQSNKTLSFKISGSYRNVNIPVNEVINISGFYNSVDNYEQFSKFESNIYISEIDFNLDSFFKNLQTKENIKNWSVDDWLNKYLLKMSISKFPANSDIISFNLLEYSQKKIFEDIKLSNVEQCINSNSWASLSVSVSYANYQYDSSSKVWTKIVNSSSKTMNFKSASFLKFNAPDKQEAIEWIAQYGTIFNTSVTSQYFASYWYSQYQQGDSESINSFVTIEEKYKTKYFDDKLVLLLDTMTINDLDGTMSISYKLDYNSNQFISSPFSISTSSFKKLSETIKTLSLPNINNTILVKNDSPKSSLVKNIIKTITTDFTSDELRALVKDQPSIMKSAPVLLKNTREYRLFNANKSNINDRLDEKYITSSITPFLFGKQISRSTIDVDKNLFLLGRRSENTKKFMINYITVNVPDNTKATLTRTGNTTFLYKVPFKYTLDIESDSSQLVEVDSYYFAYILNSDLGL